MSKKILTQEYLKELFDYNQETGRFIHKLSKGSAKSGSIAGHVASERKGFKRYRYLKVDGSRYLAHRAAWLYITGEHPVTIDHIDGNSLNNRFDNLRSVTLRDNAKNIKKTNNYYLGVSRIGDMYRAVIGVDNKRIHLGMYDNYIDAGIVRYIAERRYGFHNNHGVI